ncbi:MAG: hypothetical protein HY557_06930 [Euryarchaeota archaeon]|nr:hypothetical protein [Euryarchaeota archaeon]
MESFVQRLSKKRETEQAITVLPVLDTRKEHGGSCDCGEAGCGSDEGGCCGG